MKYQFWVENHGKKKGRRVVREKLEIERWEERDRERHELSKRERKNRGEEGKKQSNRERARENKQRKRIMWEKENKQKDGDRERQVN